MALSICPVTDLLRIKEVILSNVETSFSFENFTWIILTYILIDVCVQIIVNLCPNMNHLSNFKSIIKHQNA